MSFAYSIINIYSSSSSNSSSQRMYKPPPTFAAAAAAAVAANKVRLCVISPCIDCRLRSRALGSRLYMKRERERGGLIVSAAAALLQSSSLLLLASFFSLFFFFFFFLRGPESTTVCCSVLILPLSLSWYTVDTLLKLQDIAHYTQPQTWGLLSIGKDRSLYPLISSPSFITDYAIINVEKGIQRARFIFHFWVWV